jgi:hypothetical protein
MKNEEKTTSNDPPAPEVLKPQEDGDKPPIESNAPSVVAKKPKLTNVKLRHSTYRPSHKATFIGIAVVIVILAINAVIIMFVLNGKDEASTDTNNSEVVISTDVLDKLGVSRNPVETAGTELAIGPNTSFGGTVTVAGNTSIGGQLSLNGKLSVADASVSKLQAGDTSFNKINVSGDGTLSSLNLRKDLTVVGSTKLQGAVTVSQLMTVYNNLNVSGSLSVGGTLSIRDFQTNTLTIGGHITTRGSAPSVSPGGSALGSNGNVTLSGNDVAGTVAVNVGVGATSGIVAYVTFVTPYATTPHVVITGVGGAMGSYYINRNANGFSIGVTSPLTYGGYAFDYIVMQ